MDASQVDSRAYRRTMGLFATGVTVLATETESGEIIAMTANAITSVSLDPLLLLVCVAKDANVAPHLLSANRFSLSFLAQDQAALSDYFAGISHQAEPPAFTFERMAEVVRLRGCIAAIGCTRFDVLEGGDHWIILGKVEALHRPDTLPDPLVFYGGLYRRLAPIDE